VPTLEPPDCHHVAAAIGWLELGNPAEAEVELRRVSAANAAQPDVLEVRWALHAERKDWDAGLAVARELVAVAPERVTGWLHQAYALRRVNGGGLRAAWDALLPVAERFPDEATVAYNLACYACQMAQPEVAREWFRKALERGGKEQIKAMALADTDLQPLWQEIALL
jgi:tetratricopeptide (TPR) repeat protein